MDNTLHGKACEIGRDLLAHRVSPSDELLEHATQGDRRLRLAVQGCLHQYDDLHHLAEGFFGLRSGPSSDPTRGPMRADSVGDKPYVLISLPSTPPQPPSPESHGEYDVFISYRRDPDAPVARLILERLLAWGLKAFLDVEDIGPSRVDAQLLARIERASHFIVILSPGSLERCADPKDWLRREIAHAISTGRKIIPVLVSGFRFPPTLPPDIDELAGLSGIEYSHIYFEAAMQTLKKFLGLAGADRATATLQQR